MTRRHLSCARTGVQGRRRGAGRAQLRSPIHGLAGQRAWRRIHTRSQRRDHAIHGGGLLAMRPREVHADLSKDS
jgi:hypothetical protein